MLPMIVYSAWTRSFADLYGDAPQAVIETRHHGGEFS
jgi:hypothetical protein